MCPALPGLGPSAKYWGLWPSILGPKDMYNGPLALISVLALRSKNGTGFHQPIKKIEKKNFFLLDN